jgi:hypothetical protein
MVDEFDTFRGKFFITLRYFLSALKNAQQQTPTNITKNNTKDIMAKMLISGSDCNISLYIKIPNYPVVIFNLLG